MKGRDLLEQVFDHLSIIEKDYFGICYHAETNKMVSGTTMNKIIHLCDVSYSFLLICSFLYVISENVANL